MAVIFGSRERLSVVRFLPALLGGRETGQGEAGGGQNGPSWLWVAPDPFQLHKLKISELKRGFEPL